MKGKIKSKNLLILLPFMGKVGKGLFIIFGRQVFAYSKLSRVGKA
jgi:hypothetical protein